MSWLGPHPPLESSPEKDLGQAGSRRDRRREKQGVIPCKAGTKAGVGASHILTPAPWPLGLLIGPWVQPLNAPLSQPAVGPLMYYWCWCTPPVAHTCVLFHRHIAASGSPAKQCRDLMAPCGARGWPAWGWEGDSVETGLGHSHFSPGILPGDALSPSCLYRDLGLSQQRPPPPILPLREAGPSSYNGSA